MNVYQKILLGWYALSAIFTVLMVGRKREPLTPGAAVFTLLIVAGLAWLVTKT